MPLRSHLLRRGRRYYFRRRVPSDLVNLLGRKEIIKSLRVTCPRQAARLVLHVSWAYEELFERFRNMEDNHRNKGRNREVCLDWSTDVMLPKSLQYNAGRPMKDFRIGLLDLTSEWSKEAEEAKDQAREAGAALAKEVKLRHEALATPRESPRKIPTVADFLSTFVDEKGGHWDESAYRHNINYIKLFLKIVGDKAFNEYLRQDILRYVRTLECVHRTYGKSSKDRDLDIEKILQKSEGKRKFNITTLEKHFCAVKALFKVANRHLEDDLRIEKLFGGITFNDDVPPAQERKHWRIEGLNKLFATPIWKGTRAHKPSRRHQKGRRIIRDAYWWLPIIAIFTGMRLEEIAQLQRGDLKVTKEGIGYINVVEGNGKRLKTDSSKRKVPVHPTLDALGFRKLFVGGGPVAERIFPELPPGGPKGKFGFDYSADFTEYRRKTGLYEELMDFHSLRHTFITHLWRATKDMFIVGEIAGHETKQIETLTYIHAEVADTFAAISKLDYEKEGLKIGHLFPSPVS